MIRVSINVPDAILPEIEYAWSVFCRHFKLEYAIVDDADLIIGLEEGNIKISRSFEDIISSADFEQTKVFPTEPVLRCESGEKDFLGTAFYMLNSLQEYADSEPDKYGRFQYQNSYQAAYKVAGRALVDELFEELFTSLKLKGVQKPEAKKRVFLTHDIDRVYSSTRSEMKHAIKRVNPIRATKLLAQKSRKKSEWANAREIINLHKKYGMTSTFLWLVKQGTCKRGIENADFDISDPLIASEINAIQAAGFDQGLHKSSFEESFDQEADLLPFRSRANRNHYLRYSLPTFYEELEGSKIEVDSTVGFSEALGYRNSYGRPFSPFNLKTRKPYTFLEVPLNIMDVTLFEHSRLSKEEALEHMTDLVNRSPEGSLTTILWHNNYLTKHRYADRLWAYENLLTYLKKEGIESVSLSDLIDQ